MKQRNHHRHTGPDEPQTLTRAVTHIRLEAINPGKLAALDTLAQVYLALCQQYVTLFCTAEPPDKFHATCFATALSERWHRVAIQQAAGIAQSWRTNREQAAEGTLDADAKEPTRHEWNIPTLSNTCIQANVKVAVLKPAQDSSFHGELRERQKRDREKRRRKAKLRKCLEKKGARTLPSTSSASGKRLTRHVRQEINRAVNECFAEHEGARFACEQLSAAAMKHKARAMNAYMRAANLARIPAQIAWNAAKRGVRATRVKSAYTSQACQRCSYVAPSNRPEQQTFCCGVCGFRAQADENAAVNIARRLGDREVQATRSRQELKSLLAHRHQRWRADTGWP